MSNKKRIYADKTLYQDEYKVKSKKLKKQNLNGNLEVNVSKEDKTNLKFRSNTIDETVKKFGPYFTEFYRICVNNIDDVNILKSK
tara:strand:- start:49 stop:303 length:255 start_codon:yes stop_codon:yes gene_type:complete